MKSVKSTSLQNSCLGSLLLGAAKFRSLTLLIASYNSCPFSSKLIQPALFSSANRSLQKLSRKYSAANIARSDTTSTTMCSNKRQKWLLQMFNSVAKQCNKTLSVWLSMILLSKISCLTEYRLNLALQSNMHQNSFGNATHCLALC